MWQEGGIYVHASMSCLYSVLVQYKLQCCSFCFSLSFILLLLLYLHIYRLPMAFEMEKKPCEVSELCCHLWMWGGSLDCVQSAEQEVGLWQGEIHLPFSMWRVVLHDPALSSGTHSALCNTVIAPCAFFSSKNLWNMVITRVFGHTGSVGLTF